MGEKLTTEQVMGWVTMTATLQDLQDVNELIGKRYKLLRARQNAETMQKLEIGTLVAYNNNVKPTYLRGTTGTIVDFRQTRVMVELTHGPVGKFRTGRIISHPSSLKIIRTPLKLDEVEEA